MLEEVQEGERKPAELDGIQENTNDSNSSQSRKHIEKHFKTWSFGTVNIRSGKEKEEGAKIYGITKEINRAGLTFCCLQEVRYRNSGNKLIELDTGEKYEFHWSGPKRRREAGVGIIVRVDPGIEISSPDINDPRVMAINIKVHGFNIRLVNGYSPTDCGGSDNQKAQFYRKMSLACKKNQKHQKLIITGDFNATTSIALFKSCFDGNQVYVGTTSNDNGARLQSFCREKKLCISATHFEYPLEERYTWYSNDKKTKKVLDYVLVERYVQDFIKNCQAKVEFDFDSDHVLLKTTLLTPCTRRARWRKRDCTKKSKPNIKAFHDEKIRNAYVEKICRETRNFSISKTQVNASKDIIKLLETAATQTLPAETNSRKDRQIWKNDKELNDLMKDRVKLGFKSDAYKLVTKKIKKRVGILRNEKLKSEAEEVNDLASRREVEQLYKSIKNDKSAFKRTHQKIGCDISILKEHFVKHFSHDDTKEIPEELSRLPSYIVGLQHIKVDGIKTGPPDKAELRNVLKNLKNGKAANDIIAEYVKYAEKSDEFMDEMVAIFNEVWETKIIPGFWTHSRLAALWKGLEKGKISDPKAYRGLQIGSTFCKIMVITIINRMSPWYENQLLDQNQGFRSCRGTTDGIYITKRIQQISDKMKKPIYLLFVDLTAAFDHVIRKWLFMSIYQRFPPGSDKTLIELLEALYDHTTTSLAEDPANVFEIFSGVRQGGPESPPLFNLFLDYVMRVFIEECKKADVKFLKLEYRVPATATNREERMKNTAAGTHVVDWIGYADDLELVFEDVDNLQKGLQILDEIFHRYQLAINPLKTKTMILNYKYLNTDETTYPEAICHLHGDVLENVKSFRYLGDKIKYDEPSTGDTEIQLRIDLAEKKFYELSKTFFNYDIRIKTRVKILNAIVRMRLTYSCQTWNLTNVQKQRINSTYTSMLRKMMKGGYRRKADGEWGFALTNADLLRLCNTEEVSEYTSRQQKKYLAHLARQSNSTLAKRLLFNSNASCKPGPRWTLETRVLENENVTQAQFYKKALNREF